MTPDDLAEVGRALIANVGALRIARAEAESYEQRRDEPFGEYENPYPNAPAEVRSRLQMVEHERIHLVNKLIGAATFAADPSWSPAS